MTTNKYTFLKFGNCLQKKDKYLFYNTDFRYTICMPTIDAKYRHDSKYTKVFL